MELHPDFTPSAPGWPRALALIVNRVLIYRHRSGISLIRSWYWSAQLPSRGLSYSLAFHPPPHPERPERCRPNSGLEPIQCRGHHPMVRVLLELLQQEAGLVGFGLAGPVAHQAAQDFGAAHPHRAVGIFDCQGG